MAVASRWNSTVDVAQVACLTIATSSHRGVVQSSATGVWAGSSTCGAILSKGHQRVALLLSKGVQDSRQAVRLEQLAHSHFLPFLNRNFLQHRGAQSRVQIHIRYGSTRRAWCDRHNRQGRHQRPSLCSPHRGVAINRPATGVWRAGTRPDYLGCHWVRPRPRLGHPFLREWQAGLPPQAPSRMAYVRGE
jgi:hypothetical protein